MARTWRAEVREYLIPAFANWKDHDAFEAGFAKLLEAVKAEQAGRHTLTGYEVSASVRLYRDEEGTSFQNCFRQISKCDENGRLALPGIVVGQKYHVSVVVDRERMSSWTAAEMVAEEARPWDLGDRKMFRIPVELTSKQGI